MVPRAEGLSSHSSHPWSYRTHVTRGSRCEPDSVFASPLHAQPRARSYACVSHSLTHAAASHEVLRHVSHSPMHTQARTSLTGVSNADSHVQPRTRSYATCLTRSRTRQPRARSYATCPARPRTRQPRMRTYATCLTRSRTRQPRMRTHATCLTWSRMRQPRMRTYATRRARLHAARESTAGARGTPAARSARASTPPLLGRVQQRGCALVSRQLPQHLERVHAPCVD
jgi:hypothetical protein